MSTNRNNDSCPPPGGRNTKGGEKEHDGSRRESGVFLSPQNSREPESLAAPCPETAPKYSRESGYYSGLSESSSVSHDLHGTSPAALFYLAGANVDEDESGAVLLDSGSHTDPDDDETDEEEDDTVELSGVSTCTLREGRRTSLPMAIPGANNFHEGHALALRGMDATPPRSYMLHPPQRGRQVRSGHRYSTGCLSGLSPVIVKILNEKRETHAGQCLERGLRVASGRLHSSSSRAELNSRRKSDAPPPSLEFIQEHASSQQVRGLHRDRSQSAPDIGAIVVIQCGQELRKISDEFFAEIPQMNKHGKGRPRTQSQSPSHHCLGTEECGQPSSYPGTGRRSHSSWWWQAIIQSIAPDHARRGATSATGTAAAPTLPRHLELPDIENNLTH